MLHDRSHLVPYCVQYSQSGFLLILCRGGVDVGGETVHVSEEGSCGDALIVRDAQAVKVDGHLCITILDVFQRELAFVVFQSSRACLRIPLDSSLGKKILECSTVNCGKTIITVLLFRTESLDFPRQLLVNMLC